MSVLYEENIVHNRHDPSILTAGCGREVIPPDPAPATTAVTTEVSTTADTTSEPPSSVTVPTSIPVKSDDVAAVLAQIYPGDERDEELIRMIMTQAKNLNLQRSDGLAAEEDAIARAKEAFEACGYADWIEWAESEYVELNGERVRYQRSNNPYTVRYFEVQDIWYVQPNAPCGITEDGRKVAAPSMPPYVLMYGTNGEVLALF